MIVAIVKIHFIMMEPIIFVKHVNILVLIVVLLLFVLLVMIL